MRIILSFILIPLALAAFDLPPAVEPSLMEEEMGALDNLIAATEKNLARQRELKKYLIEYKEGLALYLKNSSNKEVIYKTAKIASRVLELIKENYLLNTFEADFISELTLFSQIAEKRGLSKS
jgi:hypothetical protein